MLSTAEKRFVRYWQEQRTGGKGKYFAMYVVAGTIMISLFIFVALFFGFQVRPSIFVFSVVPAIAIVLSLLFTAYGWGKNERQFKSLLKREIDESRQADTLDQAAGS